MNSNDYLLESDNDEDKAKVKELKTLSLSYA